MLQQGTKKGASKGVGGLALLGGVGIGAALMYLLDPDRGARRRALARDKATHLLAETRESVTARSRDTANRLRGFAAEARARLTPEDVSDAVLVGRVRAELGRLVSSSRSIEVTATHGMVTLQGEILADEVDELLRAVRRVRGVHDLVSQLEVHQTAEGVPGLQSAAAPSQGS
ncbi:MAG TPA: BON domain-containing protein [Gemmatimonadaceae bacterium]|nr:BON domain-containing protein [Gemmatimonadaceae bacterium]